MDLSEYKNPLFCLCLAVLFLSCGKKDDSPPDTLAIGAEFTPYVARFETASGQYGSKLTVTNLVIQFGDTQSSTERGACEIGGGNPPTIIVNQESWNRISDAEREEFLFHELGHCVLRRKHKTGYDGDGKPLSIMFPYSMDALTYQNKQGAYLAELFRTSGEF